MAERKTVRFTPVAMLALLANPKSVTLRTFVEQLRDTAETFG